MRVARSTAVVAFMVLMVAAAGFTGTAAANPVNYDADAAQNPYIMTDVTVASHDRGSMDSVTQYEDDSGDLATLPATVNDSEDHDDLGNGHVNEISLVATDINFSDAGQFPRKSSGDSDNEISALDAGEWSTESGSGMTTSDVTTAPNTPAVELGTNGSMSAGDEAFAEYTNFSVTSDVDKRYLQFAADVDTLDSGARVEIQAYDSDGDHVEVVIEPDASQESPNNATVLANATGEGDVIQEQVGSLTVVGSGDGTMSEIQMLNVTVRDADANVDFSVINLERTSEYKFGERYSDADDDDELETNTTYEPHGTMSIYDISTMGAVFDSATIHDLTAPMDFRAQDLSADSDVSMSFSEASNYPNFDHIAEVYYRISLPSAYDLSYSNAELKDTVAVPDGRYVTVETSEGVGDTDFDDVSFWTSQKSSYSTQGSEVSLDTTISADTEYAIHYEYTLTSSEKASLESTGGGAAGPIGGGGGGFIGGIVNFVTDPFGAVASILGVLGVRRYFGG